LQAEADKEWEALFETGVNTHSNTQPFYGPLQLNPGLPA